MPFVKGDPRINREGRPEGSISVVSALKRELAKCPDGEKKTYLDLLVKRILKKGIVDGDASIIKDIINRVDGMPTESIEHRGEVIIGVSLYGNKATTTVPGHTSDKKDIPVEEENTSS